LIIINHHNL